jgi:hypothetical protein
MNSQMMLLCVVGTEPPVMADAGTRTEVVSADKLISLLQERAQAAVDAGSSVRTMAVCQ